MDRIFINAVDLHVATVVLHAKDTSDGFIYADAKHTQTVDRATLLDLCLKGMVLILYKGAYHRPVFFKDSGGTVTVTIATAIGASDSAKLELKSKEPAAG